jgi:polygalacturonase
MDIILKPFGNKVCTKQIQKAIDKVNQCGGGTVTLSSGNYLSGSIELKSNVCFNLSMGAVLKATGNISDFPYIGFMHNEMGPTKSFIWARNSENITLCGDGIIDFSDEYYYTLGTPTAYEIDGVKLNQEQIAESVTLRTNSIENTINQPIFFESCKKITVKNLKFYHSTFWTLTFSRSEDIIVYGLDIDNRRVTGNSDGIHLSASKNAVISNCNIKAGDDCIAVTCITAHGDVSENITITNCNFESTSAGIRLGHVNARVKNVNISNINITNSNRGIAIFARENGMVSNVHISNLNINTRVYAGGWWGKGEPLIICADSSNGQIENVTVSDVFAESENGVVIAGDNQNVRNVTINNFSIKLKSSESRELFGKALDLRPNSYTENFFQEPTEKFVRDAEVVFNNLKVIE